MTKPVGDRGSITAFVAVVAAALVMVAGMVYDGGQIIAAHGQARSDASKAARAGAQVIDVEALRLSGRMLLDPTGAEAAALAYLDEVGARGTVHIDGASIAVTVRTVQSMRILPGPDRTVVATATATAHDEVTP